VLRLLLDVSAVPDRPAGAGVYTIELARQLAARDDLDLVLLCRLDDAARWRALAPAAEVAPEVPASRPARLVWEQAVAPRLARRLGVDLWHGPHYTMPLRLAVPAVVTVHDLTFFDHPEWHERSKVVYFRQMIRAAAARAAGTVAVSRFTAARLAEVAAPRAPVTVAPHGVDHERFSPPPADPAARAGVEASDWALLAPHGIRDPYVAFQATLEPRKDVPTLVRAFAAIARDHPDLQLVLAGGDGWGAAQVRDAVARSGAASRILRPGYLPDPAVPALFRRAAAVAYPSLVEGFGLPVLEAMACGAPVVTTTGSATEEVAGDAALLVAPGDAPALARALRAVLDDPPVAARLRAAGPARAAPFTWEASAAVHVAAYEAATATTGTAGRATGSKSGA
jgi:glycosyltransferase involved in cell wall biosynthesis